MEQVTSARGWTGTDTRQGGEAAETRTDLLKHDRHQPTGACARALIVCITQVSRTSSPAAGLRDGIISCPTLPSSGRWPDWPFVALIAICSRLRRRRIKSARSGSITVFRVKTTRLPCARNTDSSRSTFAVTRASRCDNPSKAALLSRSRLWARSPCGSMQYFCMSMTQRPVLAGSVGSSKPKQPDGHSESSREAMFLAIITTFARGYDAAVPLD